MIRGIGGFFRRVREGIRERLAGVFGAPVPKSLEERAREAFPVPEEARRLLDRELFRQPLGNIAFQNREWIRDITERHYRKIIPAVNQFVEVDVLVFHPELGAIRVQVRGRMGRRLTRAEFETALGRAFADELERQGFKAPKVPTAYVRENIIGVAPYVTTSRPLR